MNEILNDYFEWLCSIVKRDRVTKRSYRKLLSFLHSEKFIYVDEYDSNRAADGEQLRWRYVYEAKGCEDILDADYSVGYWFWMMLTNLELDKMIDSKFDKHEAYEKIHIFMHRDYEPNGIGNIFVIDNCRTDLRDVEIWWQMCWYLDSIM